MVDLRFSYDYQIYLNDTLLLGTLHAFQKSGHQFPQDQKESIIKRKPAKRRASFYKVFFEWLHNIIYTNNNIEIISPIGHICLSKFIMLAQVVGSK